MARHKSVSDDDLLDRLMPALVRHGPDGLTLALAGAAAGVSPATLVQRFRSREAMIEAVLLRAWDRLDAATDAADAGAAEGAEGAMDLLAALMPLDQAETDVTDGLLLLREDFRNPVLRARGKAWGERLAAALGRRLDPAPEVGLGLGWQMLQVWQGALIWWAFTRQGTAADYVQAALSAWFRAVGLR
ncbi:MAG: TetR family transcriptional regulator [Tabrizicola sp.]